LVFVFKFFFLPRAPPPPPPTKGYKMKFCLLFGNNL
jgi:hypothetical protein